MPSFKQLLQHLRKDQTEGEAQRAAQRKQHEAEQYALNQTLGEEILAYVVPTLHDVNTEYLDGAGQVNEHLSTEDASYTPGPDYVYCCFCDLSWKNPSGEEGMEEGYLKIGVKVYNYGSEEAQYLEVRVVARSTAYERYYTASEVKNLDEIKSFVEGHTYGFLENGQVLFPPHRTRYL
ncbi:hypothetical protein KAZ57_02145 [Patescibacteria group bacterium]|nr:hypothetical protein [Patescibacteria group bacterium]